MEQRKVCLYHILREETNFSGHEMEGTGDCSVCIPDEDNKNCRMYTPISLGEYEVKDYRIQVELSVFQRPHNYLSCEDY